MRIVNRQPLNVELLTLDDGTQKIAWDIKQLQSLLGISDLLHQEELSSTTNTGVNSSGIPTIETVIAILDELGLKDLYEVRYRKQYATIIPKTDSKRPKVAMYVVQQQTEIALSIHDKIWINHLARFHWKYWDNHHEWATKYKEIYIPISERNEFFGRLTELAASTDEDVSDFEEKAYPSTNSYKSYEMPNANYDLLIADMKEQNICHELSCDQRFPSTSRIIFSHQTELNNLLLELADNIETFLRSNGENPEWQINEDEMQPNDDDF
jgi:hypothetical protein